MKRKIKTLLIALLVTTVLLQAPMTAFAADTVFMVPEISSTWDPPGMVYKTSALDALAYKGSGGFVADIINKRGLAAALTELHANVNPSKYKVSILGIYPEGEALTDSILNMIKDAGWKRIEVYYPRFFLAGSPDCAGMTPVIEKTDNIALTDALKVAGYEKEVATIKVEGVTMSNPMMILYEPEFKFLRGKTITMYKYIPDIQKFVAGPKAIYDSYDRGFMDMEDLESADGEVNGIYVVATKTLPSSVVTTKDQIQTLRDQLKPQDTQQPDAGTQMPEDNETQNSESQNTETSDSEAQKPETEENKNEVVVTNKDETIAWTFADGAIPENFTPEATIELNNEKEVKVDFAFSGKLPEGTQVTIQIPEGTAKYEDGKTLYFYYYNPETKEYEFVSEGIYKDTQVTFNIQHCSEYMITSEKIEEADIVEKGPDLLPIIGVGAVGLCVAGAAVYFIKKRK